MRKPVKTSVDLNHILGEKGHTYTIRATVLDKRPRYTRAYATARNMGRDMGECRLLRRYNRPAIGDVVYLQRKLMPEFNVYEPGAYYEVLFVRQEDDGEPRLFVIRKGGLWDHR